MSEDGNKRKSGIFVSYRTDDTGQAASRLFGSLAKVFGRERVFIDHERLEGGESYTERLQTEAAEAAVMLVLIGDRWLKAQNPVTGDRRLNELDDWVRREIQLALKSRAMVVPVLVDGARQLTEADLRTVPDLVPLVHCESMSLRRKDWKADTERLHCLLVEHGIPASRTRNNRATVQSSTKATAPAFAQFAAPTVPRHFHGRSGEIRKVLEGFQNHRWCALIAIGGSGKTSIAAKIAEQRKRTQNQSVVWLALTGTPDASVPQEWLANAIGYSVRTEPSSHQRAAQLRGLTNGASMLVVMDDAVSDSQLLELLACIGQGNDVLITAREQLGSMSRFRIELIDVPPLPVDDATRLLLDLVRVTRVDTKEMRDWNALAGAVGNHPLSLEIVAGDLGLQEGQSPASYLHDRVATNRWSEGEETLIRLRKDLKDSISRSRRGYDRAFSALGAFEGTTFSVAAVKWVCDFESVDDAKRFLLELRRRLCARGGSGDLYSLHPFVVETARQSQGTTRHVRKKETPMVRHINYYHGLLEDYGGYEWNIQNYPVLLPEEREILHAVECAATLAESGPDHRQHEFRLLCLSMVFYASWFLHWRGQWDLRVKLCERITEWAEQGLISRNSQSMVGNLYVDKGWVHLSRGEMDLAKHCVTRGVDWLRGTRDEKFAAELSGQVALRSGEHAKALKIFARLRRSESVGSRDWLVFSYRIADALRETGQAEREFSFLSKTVKLTKETLQANEKIGHIRGQILYRLARVRIERAEAVEATIAARDAVKAFHKSGIVTPERRAALGLLADLLNQAGAREECKALLVSAREEAQTLGDFETIAEADRRLSGRFQSADES